MGSANSVHKLEDDHVSKLKNVQSALSGSVLPPLDASRFFRDASLETMGEAPVHKREFLVQIIFPRLREWCEQRRIRLIEVDLRWGVPADSTSEDILRACLDEIDRCKELNVQPFFINMLSHRYGWVPDLSAGDVPSSIASQYSWVDGASVTTMEILCGAFRSRNPNAFFLLRHEDFLPHIPQEFVKDFVDSSWYSKCALDIVKNYIRDNFSPTGQVFDYHVSVGGITKSAVLEKLTLSRLDDFGNSVFDFLTRAIEKQYPGRDGKVLVEDSVLHLRYQMSEQHMLFAKSLSQLVVGRDLQIGHFISWLHETPSGDGNAATIARSKFYIVLGDYGIGKSAVMACAQEAARQGRTVIFHSSQADAYVEGAEFLFDGKNVYSLLIRLCLELGDREIQESVVSIINNDGRDGSLTTATLLSELLSRMYTDKKFGEDITPSTPALVFVDEAEVLNSAFNRLHFFQLFKYPWPQELRFVISVDVSHVSFLNAAYSAADLAIDSPFTESDQLIVLDKLQGDVLSQIVVKRLGMYNKRLSTEQLELLMANPGVNNLSWLTMACEEIRVFGAFETLSEHITALPSTIPGLVTLQLSRLANVTGMLNTEGSQKLLGLRIRDLLLLVMYSTRGLRETELRELLRNVINQGGNSAPCSVFDGTVSPDLEIPYAEWSVVFFWSKSFLRSVGDRFGQGRIRLHFRNEAVRTAVLNYFHHRVETDRFFNEAVPSEKEYRTVLATYFKRKKLVDMPRFLEEYPCQLLAMKSNKEIHEFIKSEEFVSVEYSIKLMLTSTIRCQNWVMPLQAPGPKPEIMCINCSMKSTFNPRRLNRMACCFCGYIINSRFVNQGTTVSVHLHAGEKLAIQCRLHNSGAYLPIQMPLEKCFVCRGMFDRKKCFNPVLCRMCANSGNMQLCCYASVS